MFSTEENPALKEIVQNQKKQNIFLSTVEHTQYETTRVLKFILECSKKYYGNKHSQTLQKNEDESYKRKNQSKHKINNTSHYNYRIRNTEHSWPRYKQKLWHMFQQQEVTGGYKYVQYSPLDLISTIFSKYYLSHLLHWLVLLGAAGRY